MFFYSRCPCAQPFVNVVARAPVPYGVGATRQAGEVRPTVCRLVVIGGQYKHPTSIIDTDDIGPITVQTHQQFDRSLSLPRSKINSDTSAIVLVNTDKKIKTESQIREVE